MGNNHAITHMYAIHVEADTETWHKCNHLCWCRQAGRLCCHPCLSDANVPSQFMYFIALSQGRLRFLTFPTTHLGRRELLMRDIFKTILSLSPLTCVWDCPAKQTRPCDGVLCLPVWRLLWIGPMVTQAHPTCFFFFCFFFCILMSPHAAVY